jgi:hypothetical protein
MDKEKPLTTKRFGKKLADGTQHQLLFGYLAVVLGWTL